MKHVSSQGVLFDVDGVLLNWVKPFDAWILNNYSHLCTWFNPNAYNIQQRHGISSAITSAALIRAFNSLRDFSHRPVARGDITAVERICKKFSYAGVCSCFSSDSDVYRNRITWLKELYGQDTFRDFIFLDIHESKEKTLEELRENYSVYIEDSATNAQLAHDIGYKTFLISRPWNFEIPISDQIIVCDTLKEVEQYV